MASYKGIQITGRTDSEVAEQVSNIDKFGTINKPVSFEQPQEKNTTSLMQQIINGNLSTGMLELDDLAKELADYSASIISQGKQINPNLEISPSIISDFLQQAKNEVNPYYSEKISWAQENLATNAQNLQKQYDLYKKDQEETFKKSFEGIGESMAEKGFARSGIRKKEEDTLISGSQRSLDLNALQLENKLSDLYGSTAEQIGTQGVRPSKLSYNVPTVSSSGFSRGRELEFIPKTELTGEMERSKLYDIESRKRELTNQEMKNRVLNFY